MGDHGKGRGTGRRGPREVPVGWESGSGGGAGLRCPEG